MKLPSYVKPYPRIFKYVKIFSDKGFNFGTTIYLNKYIYEDLKNYNPKPLSIAVLKHEEIHVKRVKDLGTLNWGIKYVFSSEFRLEDELLAYKEMFGYLKKHDQTYDLDRVASRMSGYQYLWVLSNKNAKELLEKTWEEA